MRLLCVLAAMFLVGCGYSSKDNELIGQVKKVTFETPLLCGDWTATDITLGVIRGGTGSMSTQDMWFTVEDRSLVRLLKSANESGAIVKATYDVARMRFCTGNHILRSVEVLK